MHRNTHLIAVIALCATGAAFAQAPVIPAAPGGRGGRGAGGGRPAAYPDRAPADPAVLDRGKAQWGVHCTFCHGSDARGGEGGPNLLRSELVLNDQKGELIGTIVHTGRGEMPKIDITDAQISDIAAFVHNFKVGGYDVSRMVPPSIVVGDPKAGEAYFKTTCAGCHSVTGDLKGIASRFTEPKQLQQYWLMPGGGRGGRGANAKPVTVTVTTPQGKVEGRLGRVDDFIVVVIDADGSQRTIRRDGDVPKVEIHDPMQPHKDLFVKYTDKDIHNLTAYLVTVK